MPERLDPERLDVSQLIERSAKRGARLALAELDLDDARAAEDLRDLRQLLVAWRKIRRHAIEMGLN